MGKPSLKDALIPAGQVLSRVQNTANFDMKAQMCKDCNSCVTCQGCILGGGVMPVSPSDS